MSTAHPAAVRPTSPWRYAVGMFGTSIPMTLVNANLMFFFVDLHGLDARAYAAVMLAYNVIDLFDNPVYGWLSDRTRSRWGRRRPWIVLGAPVLVAAFVALFAPPSNTTTGLLVWLVIFGVLTQTMDSLVNASYGAVLPEAFPDEKRRALANGLRQGCQLVALILSLGVAPILIARFGHAWTAAIVGVPALVALVWSGTGVREDLSTLAPQEPLLASLKAIVWNRRFWIIAFASACYSAGMALLLAAVPFFVKYSLGLPGASATPLMITVILTSLVCLALWTWLVRRFDALPVWRIALVVLALGLASMYLAGNLATAIACGALVGLGYSGVMATIDLIVAKLMDADLARTGQRRESMFIAAFGFFNHFTGAIQALAGILLVAWFGYRSGDDPGPHPDVAMRWMLGVMPAALMALAFLAALFVRFRPDERPAPGDVVALDRAGV